MPEQLVSTNHWAPQLRPHRIGDLQAVACDSTANNEQTTRTSILSLPRELRDRIYSYLLPNLLWFLMPDWEFTTKREKHQIHDYFAEEPIFVVNRQIRQEMLDSVFSNMIFSFQWRRRANIMLIRCLPKIPEWAKTRIRRLSWDGHSLHTGHDSRTVRGWKTVMSYIRTNFTALRVVHCHQPSSENGRHLYHNWEIPRLAMNLLIDGKIEELRWFWSTSWHPGEIPREESISIARTLLSIPYYEGVDDKMGFEFRRLLKNHNQLNGNDPLDEWATECLLRPKHQFLERRFDDCIMLRRKN